MIHTLIVLPSVITQGGPYPRNLHINGIGVSRSVVASVAHANGTAPNSNGIDKTGEIRLCFKNEKDRKNHLVWCDGVGSGGNSEGCGFEGYLIM